MNLLIKTTLFYIILASVVFGVGGIVTYRMVKKEVQKETDYYLNESFRELRKAIREGKPIDAFNNDKVKIVALGPKLQRDSSPVYMDTMAVHPHLDRLETHRKMTRISKINGQYYHFSLVDVLIESDDMYDGVVGILSRLFLYLSIALSLCGFIISSYLLRPFQTTLQKISNFNLKKQTPLELPKTSTLEFRKLNDFLKEMTEKARSDYRVLKEFTENASHEMQTPVAIAKGKLELLLESGQLSEEQMVLISGAHAAISRISKISKGLSLLNKIDNKEFTNDQELDFSALLQQEINYFTELAELKGLCIRKNLEPGVSLSIDPNLAHILLSNLIRNAIQHNLKDGWIEITLNTKQLVVRNSGPQLTISPQQLFERFRKGNQSGGSLGLGLAIVKRICDVHAWKVTYTNEEEVHQIGISFS